MREIFSQALGATRATASVMARDLLGSRAEDPLAERDPRFIRQTLPAYSRAAQLYFRPKVRGLEQIPAEGPVLLVGNHSGGTLIADTFAFAYGFYNYFGPDRLFHQLAHDLVFRVPGLAMLRRYGTIPANHENAMTALGKGAALLVYPGGDHETYRPSWHSGEIDFGHRSGFVRLALATDVPIVPVVAIGGQETALFLTRGERLSHLLALDRLLRLKVVPIQIAPPFGVTVLDLPGRIPLPSQITIQVLPRIDLRRRFGPQPDEEAVYNAVTTMMQEALDELSAERELPVVGTLGSRHEDERSRRGAGARRSRARGRGRDRGRRSQGAGWAEIEPAAQCVGLDGKRQSFFAAPLAVVLMAPTAQVATQFRQVQARSVSVATA